MTNIINPDLLTEIIEYHKKQDKICTCEDHIKHGPVPDAMMFEYQKLLRDDRTLSIILSSVAHMVVMDTDIGMRFAEQVKALRLLNQKPDFN